MTKNFVYKERYRLGIFGEVFNAFNIANLRGYGSTLDIRNPNPLAQTYAFGQPTQRVLQTFGSAGPRAFQVGARLRLMPQSLGNRYDRPLLASFPSFTMREAC